MLAEEREQGKEAVNANLIQGIEEDVGLNSMVGEIHAATGNEFI